MAGSEKILGVEGGGTKTSWVLVERDTEGLRVIDQGKLPASNFRLTPPDKLQAIFRQMPADIARAGIFLAGCGPDDQKALASLCAEIWPQAKIVTGSDRESGLAAGLGRSDGIVVNAGTGASVTGRRGDHIEKAGGWGHILGDSGGAYFVSIRALRLILREYDLRRGERRFAAHLLGAVALNKFDALVPWAHSAE